MKSIFRLFAVLLAFALLGAPLGMARMMGLHEVSAHQHHERQTPPKSAPHAQFMVCAACIGVMAPSATLPELPPLAQTIAFAEIAAPDGLNAIPLLPPPQL